MIEINLLPQELKKRRKKIELPDISFLPVVAGLLGGIIILHLLLGTMLALRIGNLKRLEKRWQAILPDKEKADKLKAEFTATRNKVDAIDKLEQSRHSWARRLNDISDAMIPGVWLNKLWLEKRVIVQERPEKNDSEETDAKTKAEPKKTIIRTLHLNGSVIAAGGEETAIIGKFIRSLKDNQEFFSDFKDIESASIQRTKLKEEETMDFELICYFK
jgi:hypothetical protein